MSSRIPGSSTSYVDDLATPVIRKMSGATDALASLLVEVEGFRGR